MFARDLGSVVRRNYLTQTWACRGRSTLGLEITPEFPRWVVNLAASAAGAAMGGWGTSAIRSNRRLKKRKGNRPRRVGTPPMVPGIRMPRALLGMVRGSPEWVVSRRVGHAHGQ